MSNMEVVRVKAHQVSDEEITYLCPFKCWDEKIYGKIPRSRQLPKRLHSIPNVNKSLNDAIVEVVSSHVPDCKKFSPLTLVEVEVDMNSNRRRVKFEEVVPPQQKEVAVSERFESPVKKEITEDVPAEERVSLLNRLAVYI